MGGHLRVGQDVDGAAGRLQGSQFGDHIAGGRRQVRQEGRPGRLVKPDGDRAVGAWGGRRRQGGETRARATAEVSAAEANPGSGVPVRATGEALKVMDQATTRAQGTGTTPPTEAAVLDALSEVLTEGGKPEAAKGLKDFRAKLGDANAKRALDSELGKGNDLASFLTEKGM